MSTLCKRAMNCMKKVDVFATNEFLRYKGESEYRTATGGCTSILIIGIFLIFFFSQGIKTANKEIIYSEQTNQHDTEPSCTSSTFDPKQGFMLAFYLQGVDLNQPNSTYLNISFKQQFFSPVMNLINETQIPLEPCTRAHFSEQGGISEELFNRLNSHKWKCPQLGSIVTLGGTPTSEIYAVVRLSVSKCNITIDPTCKSDELFSTSSTQRFIMPTINTLVNAGQSDYRKNYFLDTNYFIFSEILKAFAYIPIQDVTIQTDQSLLPLTDMQVQQFSTFPDNFEQRTTQVESDGQLIQAQLRKSPSSVTYSRRFNKFDEFFSYVGGLVGTVLSVVFIIHCFSQKAFEVSLASQIYKDDDSNQIESDSFHILYLLMIPIKKLMEFCGSEAKWDKTDLYTQCIEEIQEQLDISLILKRIEYCEKASNLLLQQKDIEPDQLMSVMTLRQAEQARNRYTLLSQSSGKDGSPHQSSDAEDRSGKGEVLVFNEYTHEDAANNTSHASNLRAQGYQESKVPSSINPGLTPENNNSMSSFAEFKGHQIRRQKVRSRQRHSAKRLPVQPAPIIADGSDPSMKIDMTEYILTEPKEHAEIDQSIFNNISSSDL